MTALQNISLAPMKVRKWPKQKAEQKAMALLKRVGIPDKADEIIFMDFGKIVERGTYEEFFNNPKSERAKEFLDQIL